MKFHCFCHDEHLAVFLFILHREVNIFQHFPCHILFSHFGVILYSFLPSLNSCLKCLHSILGFSFHFASKMKLHYVTMATNSGKSTCIFRSMCSGKSQSLWCAAMRRSLAFHCSQATFHHRRLRVPSVLSWFLFLMIFFLWFADGKSHHDSKFFLSLSTWTVCWHIAWGGDWTVPVLNRLELSMLILQIFVLRERVCSILQSDE
jgi:hypothetical protein